MESSQSPDRDTKVSAAPNHFRDKITVKLTNDFTETVTVRIWNVSGRMVFEQNYTLPEGENKIDIESLGKLPKGTYLLRVFKGAVVSEGIKLLKD